MRPATEARSRQVQDGVAAFADEAGLEFHCAYGNHQVTFACDSVPALSYFPCCINGMAAFVDEA